MLLHKPNTLVIDPLAEDVLVKLSQYLNINYYLHFSIREMASLLSSAELLILRSGHVMTEEWLDNMVNIKGIIRAGTGMDNIPEASLERRGIRFTNLSGVNTNAVVEFALCAILMMLRNIYPAILDLTAGRWEKAKYCGEELAEQKIGLFGYGNIGKALAKKLVPFNISLLYYSRNFKEKDIETGAIPVDIEQLCKNSSIITIQVPLTEDTQYIINDRFFSFIENPIYLLNLSRYKIIDMQALKKAILDGKIKAAFIDPIEKNINIQEFTGLPIYFTPHLAGSTLQAQHKIGEEILNILSQWKLIDYNLHRTLK